jgi:hypothetical protein
MAESEFREFIRYMRSLWAILAGVTAVFPLSDILFKVIPLPVDAYEKSTAGLAIPVTTVVTLFMLFFTFVQRDRFSSAATARSGLFFLLGLFCLVIFFLLGHFEESLRMRLLPGLDSTDDYIILLVAVVPFYVGFFAFVTRAFTILALMEFKRKGMASRHSRE